MVESLSASHKLQPNPHAARALALLAPTPQAAWRYYLEGWSALQPQPRSSPGNKAFENSVDDPLRDAVMDSLVREVRDHTDAKSTTAVLNTRPSIADVQQMCEFCRATGMLLELRSFLLDVTQANLRGSDAVQYSVAMLAMNNSDWKTTMATISNHCWPVYASSQHMVRQHASAHASN
eukprot:COSAG02_NODE_7739_length_2868_cov_1.903575_3_plen_177_part_01